MCQVVKHEGWEQLYGGLIPGCETYPLLLVKSGHQAKQVQTGGKRYIMMRYPKLHAEVQLGSVVRTIALFAEYSPGCIKNR